MNSPDQSSMRQTPQRCEHDKDPGQKRPDDNGRGDRTVPNSLVHGIASALATGLPRFGIVLHRR
jgi:hypothetical protein